MSHPVNPKLPGYPGARPSVRYPLWNRFRTRFLAPIRSAVFRGVRLARHRRGIGVPRWFVANSHRQLFQAPTWQAGPGSLVNAYRKQVVVRVPGTITRPHSRETRAGPKGAAGKLDGSDAFGARSRPREASAGTRIPQARQTPQIPHRGTQVFHSVPRFSPLARAASRVRSVASIDNQRSFSPRRAAADTRSADVRPVSARDERWAEDDRHPAAFEQFRQIPRDERAGDAAETTRGQQLLHPESAIDRLELGDWITQYLERQMMRPPVSMTGSDPRLTPVWAGPSFGF